MELQASNITLATVQSSRSDNFNAGNADNRFLSNSSKDIGTTLQSIGNITLKAANVFSATAASIKAGGDLDVSATKIALLAGQAKANADSVMTNTSGDWISSTTDTSSKRVSIASEIQSNQAINVTVGNSARFEGANLAANTIAFNSTDPTKAGQLNLNGSVDATHTAKSDTLGLYQSHSGSGSITQTLNLTKINGDVTFDPTLGVNVQLPKVVSTSREMPNTEADANAATWS